MKVRSATVSDAQAIVDLNLAENPFGGWFRNPIKREGPCSYDDLTPFQRALHGGWWMDVGLCRRHLHEYISRGFPVFVAEHGGKVVGECELWLGEEAAPFRKYGEIEILTSHEGAGREEVELALIEKCEERCRKLEIRNLDVSPEHTGGFVDYEKLGFREIWDTRECEAKFTEIEEPDFDFKVEPLAEDYSVTDRFQLWNHREPARLRFEVMLSLWPPWKLAGGDRHEKRLFMRVRADTLNLEYLVMAWRPDWMPHPLTEVDIWSAGSVVRKKSLLQAVIKSATATVERLGEGSVHPFVPKQALPAMRELGFKGGEKPDRWLRKVVEESAP